MTSRLVAADGTVRLGVFADAIDEVNHRDFVFRDPFGKPRGALARHFGFHQFQFLGGLSEQLVFGCAIVDTRWVASAFVYCYDPATRRRVEHSVKRPLGMGLACTDTPEVGTTAFAAGGARFAMHGDVAPRARRLEVVTDAIEIAAVFDEETPPMEPMRLCTRAGATGWVYARKTAGVTMRGSLRWDDARFDLGTLGIHGHHDWSGGFMRPETFWNWACLAGRVADGRIVGLNVSCGVNETSVTENCFWVDGRLHKVDTVAFDYDQGDLMRPWRVRSADGRVQLEFVPEGMHVERLNAILLASNFQQLFGRFTGTLTTAAGERIAIAGMLGFCEEHYAKW
jgi:uncharacterized protein DUF2804